MNRIAAAIVRMKAQIEDRIARGLTTAEKVEETRKAFDMDIIEYAKFQELKTLAVSQGKLTLEEGQTVYNYLGEIPSTFNRQPVHVKYALTSLFKELLQQRLGV